ncbi:AAA family ATPase [Aeromicrobium sp.]|nr:AAA family ATPase [Candidatus Saccharibacteria bacterium]
MALNLKIIGIGGTNGSGKDSVGQVLADRHSYLFVSVTDLLRAELHRRGVPVEREHLRELSAEWRREYGLAVLVDRALEEFNNLKGKYVGIAIASLRNPAEADRIHELGGVVLWIDSNAQTRYERIQNNAEARSRAGEDSKSFEEFLAEEEAEMHPSGDAATLDMSGVKKKADIILDNDQTNLTDFQDFITEQLFGVHKSPVAPIAQENPDTPLAPTA